MSEEEKKISMMDDEIDMYTDILNEEDRHD